MAQRFFKSDLPNIGFSLRRFATRNFRSIGTRDLSLRAGLHAARLVRLVAVPAFDLERETAVRAAPFEARLLAAVLGATEADFEAVEAAPARRLPAKFALVRLRAPTIEAVFEAGVVLRVVGTKLLIEFMAFLPTLFTVLFMAFPRVEAPLRAAVARAFPAVRVAVPETRLPVDLAFEIDLLWVFIVMNLLPDDWLVQSTGRTKENSFHRFRRPHRTSPDALGKTHGIS